MHPTRTLLVRFVAPMLLLAACGPGGAAQTVRPADPTAAGALKEGTCHDVSGGGEPLVVDWKPEQRGDLEIAMREGIAVVSYSCEGINLLKDCRIDGNYGYLGMTRKEQVVRLADSDEVRANLPLSGAKLGAEMKRGASLDVAMVMVGKQKTTWQTPSREDLKGSCDGATHFVRGATVGAFVLETSTSGEAKAAAAFFGAETAGASSSKRQVQNKDGDLGACKSASPKSPGAPDQCGAPIRLLLSPIAKSAEPPAEGKPSELARVESTCPTGLVMAEGKCTKADSAPAYLCSGKDQAECSAQCDKGNAASCGVLGLLLAPARGGSSEDLSKAVGLFDKGCKGGDVSSCVNFAKHLMDGAGVAKDESAAAKLLEQACTDGNAVGCGLFGLAARDGRGTSKDTARALEALRLACGGGHGPSCGNAGRLMLADEKPDFATAAKLFQRACQGADANACYHAGSLQESGKSGGKNAVLADINYRRGCIMADADACYARARMEVSKPSGGNADEAKRAFAQACMRRSAPACAALKVLYGDNRTAMASATELSTWRQECNQGEAQACTKSALIAAGNGNRTLATTELRRACSIGDAFACFVQKSLK